MSARVPAFFHPEQLDFRPRYEWALGRKLAHPERTERADNILAALEEASDRYVVREPLEQPLARIERHHSAAMLRLYEAAIALEPGEDVNPSVFVRSSSGPPETTNLSYAGYHCFDSGTPLNREVCAASQWSAGAAVSAAEMIALGGAEVAYALSRPPGHHAAFDRFGGYCYLNNNALAADVLREKYERVAIVDVDAHHGNGTQELFWRDGQVLTISLHGDPAVSFPFFWGHADEVGDGPGRDRNINVPLPEGTRGDAYLRALEEHVLPAVRQFEAEAIVVAAGVDAYVRDPVGNLALTTRDFSRIGRCLGQLERPCCIVQEGGYYTPDIGANVVALLDGLCRELLGG